MLYFEAIASKDWGEREGFRHEHRVQADRLRPHGRSRAPPSLERLRGKGEHPGCYPGPYAATVQQRGGEYAKVIVSGFYDLWSGGIPEIRSDLRNRLGIHG